MKIERRILYQQREKEEGDGHHSNKHTTTRHDFLDLKIYFFLRLLKYPKIIKCRCCRGGGGGVY